MKTGCVALFLCLNISVDPPDVIKISPCARMECWIGELHHALLIVTSLQNIFGRFNSIYQWLLLGYFYELLMHA